MIFSPVKWRQWFDVVFHCLFKQIQKRYRCCQVKTMTTMMLTTSAMLLQSKTVKNHQHRWHRNRHRSEANNVSIVHLHPLLSTNSTHYEPSSIVSISCESSYGYRIRLAGKTTRVSPSAEDILEISSESESDAQTVDDMDSNNNPNDKGNQSSSEDEVIMNLIAFHLSIISTLMWFFHIFVVHNWIVRKIIPYRMTKVRQMNRLMTLNQAWIRCLRTHFLQVKKIILQKR